MAYEPNKRYKIKWQTALPLLLLFCLIIYFVFGGIVKLITPGEERFTICNYSQQQTKEVFEKKNNEVQEVSDYLYYGENLSFYGEDYYPENGKLDSMVGTTLLLYNMCTPSAEALAYTVYQEIDRGIDVGTLAPGFYRLEVLESLVHRDVVADEDFNSEVIYTVPRNGKSKKIQIISNPNILSDYEIVQKHNYVYLSVEEVEPVVEEIDVLIDPYGYNVDGSDYSLPDEGVSGFGLVENQEMWFAATTLKTELESYGLRVEITKKEQNEVIETYGKTGRLAKGYERRAKYYLQLVVDGSSDPNQRGIYLMYSSQSTSGLAGNIVYNMKSTNEELVFINALSNNPGIRQSDIVLTPGLDGRVVYDSNMYLRETGGKATMAAIFSTMSLDKNASFAKDNVLGMQGLSVYFGYFTNGEDVAYWKENKEAIVKNFAKSFMISIGVPVEENK